MRGSEIEPRRARVRAVASGGRLVSLEIGPRLMRESPETVAGVVAEAVGAAFEEHLAEERAGAQHVPVVEPLALARELRALRADLDARMARVTASIEASADRLREAAEVPRGVPVMDFAELFDQLIDVLETIGAAPAVTVGEAAGQAGGGLVGAVCASGPRLVSLTMSPRAMGGGARALGGLVVSAVNAALDELAAEALRGRAEAADPERIRARIGELRELGVVRMRAYAQGMAGLMAGIRPRD